jgi:hypothetical protein
MAHPDRFLLAGVMGWPVMHSRSPLLHNYWFGSGSTMGCGGGEVSDTLQSSASPEAKLLEDKFQAELNLPVVRARRCYSPSGIVIGTVLKDRLHVGLAEICVVENVEEFGSERNGFILLEVEPLEDGEVDIHEPGSDDGVSPQIPEETRNRGVQSQRVR